MNKHRDSYQTHNFNPKNHSRSTHHFQNENHSRSTHHLNKLLVSNGYSIIKNKNDRRMALKNISKKNGANDVIEKMQIIMNQVIDPNIKKIYYRDLSYLKKIYMKQLDKYVQVQYGGKDDEDENEEVIIEEIEYPENISENEEEVVENDTSFIKKICDTEFSPHKCIIDVVVYELHKIDNDEIIFYTLTDLDINDVFNIAHKFNPYVLSSNEISNKMLSHKGHFIGIKINGILNGYFYFDPQENNEVDIIDFYAEKKYGSTLYQFLERFFSENGFTRIYTTIKLNIEYAVRLLNFWYGCGFLTYGLLMSEQCILLEKFL
jgi:hypothetical protein